MGMLVSRYNISDQVSSSNTLKIGEIGVVGSSSIKYEEEKGDQRRRVDLVLGSA